MILIIQRSQVQNSVKKLKCNLKIILLLNQFIPDIIISEIN